MTTTAPGERHETLLLREVAPTAPPPQRPKSDHNRDLDAFPEIPKKRGWMFPLAVVLFCLGVAAAVFSYYQKSIAPYETTDDAFIEADATPMAPQVPGQIVKLLVNDNQQVKEGELLLQIDPREYQAKLDQAKAELGAARSRVEQAKAQYAVDQAKVEQEKASVVAAEADAQYAAADFVRFKAVGNLGVSRSEVDLAGTRARSSAAQVDVARNKELAAESEAALDKANIQTAESTVQLNEAAVRQAELDLAYTRLTAPVSGYITHRSIQDGTYVQPGQQLLAIVPRQVWVVANFKETQLARMRPGQEATVSIDAYPQEIFKGHVDSVQAGTGARFSLLPPENATGNYVKVVQRVPVKILLDGPLDPNIVLSVGMSVVPKIRVN
jgi:membrane fusion protein (multidrug efflux system)